MSENMSEAERVAFEEIRSALDEIYTFASTSPRARDNINFISEKLDEIETRTAPPQSKGLTDAELPTFSCIAPSCHQWDGGNTCTCQRMQALAVLQRVATALPVLKLMLRKEGLAGVDVADEMIKDIGAILTVLQPTANPGKEDPS